MNKKRDMLPVMIAIVLVASLVMNCLPVYAENAGTSATVLNSAPSVDVGLTPDDDPATPGVQVINPDPTTTNKTVTITTNVCDLNGWDDIVNTSVTATITGPSMVEDSPVNLSFDSVVNMTTATYTGSFNMSDHSEGWYTVEVTATDFGGLEGTGSINFEYLYTAVDIAYADIYVSGTVTGDFGDTHASDDVYEAIEEFAITTGKPSGRISYLGHKWMINVTAETKTQVTFYLEAHHTANTENDDFIFAYSTDDSTYTDMVTVTKTTDDNTYQTFEMPNTTSGIIYIRVRDTDRTGGYNSKDTIYIDHLFIRSTTVPPDTTPPAKVTGVTVTTVSANQLDVSWTANTEPDLDLYNIYRSETCGFIPDASNLVASPTTHSYSDTGLTAGTTHYYKITAVDTAANEGEASEEASGTTAADTIGPVTSDVVASPNPTNGAGTVTLTATISDSGTGNSKIVATEYFVNVTGDDGTGTAMNASDGAFDSVTEGVTADINVSGWSVGNYTLYVHGKDEAGNWGGTSSVVLEVTEESSNVMHVHSINMSVSKRTAGKNTFTHATALITIVDAANNPVEGATVYGTWSNATSDSDSGITNSTGQVSLDSDEVKNVPSETTFTFTVDDVSKADWIYDPAANVETSDSITVGTYDFSTGAGVDKWAYRYQCNAKPPTVSDVPDDEFRVKQYNNIKIADDTMQEDASSANGYYAIHRFKIDIEESEASITKLEVLWDGAGFRRYGTHGATLYIWNFSAGKYEQLDRKTDIYITLEGTITDNIGDYIEDDTLIIIAEQNSPQVKFLWWTFSSRIGTDYVKVVTYTPKPYLTVLDITPGATTVHPGDDITFAVDVRNDGASGYGYVGGAAKYPNGTYCNTEWEKTNYLSSGDTYTAHLDWTVPEDAPTDFYGFVSATWDACWDGCEASPCYFDGCCGGEQDRYDEEDVLEVVG